MRSDGPHVVGKNIPQLVLGHLAKIGGATAKTGDPGYGIASRAAGGFDPRGHAGIEVRAAGLVHQHHGPLVEAFCLQERLVSRGNHINNGIADRSDIIEQSHGAGAFSKVDLGG